MARVVLIADPDTGALIDVVGNNREGGRYYKFAKRMLSLSKNPVLDYGANGGDTLTIAKGVANGAAINLKADTVNVSGTLKVGNVPLDQIIANKSGGVDIRGTEGEIDVTPEVDEATGKMYTQLSLNPTIQTDINGLREAIATLDMSKYVSKRELSEAIGGVEIDPSDDLEDVKAKLSSLLANLAGICTEGPE